MSKGGRYLKKKGISPKKGNKVVKIVLLTLLVLLIAGVIGGVIFYNSMLNLVSRAEVIEKDVTVDPALLGIMEETEPVTETTEEPTEAPPTTLPYTPSEKDIINILVVGQAARGGEDYRYSDTMILATINKPTKTLTLTSFLRDTYVDMPDYMGHTCGWNRINTVYHLGWQWGDTGGAMEMMNMCLENNFGVKVDYNIEVDFNAFQKIINLIGGVSIHLTQEEADYMNENFTFWEVDFKEGRNMMIGEEALVYARMRKAEGDNDSDIKRTSRQRYLIQRLLSSIAKLSFEELMNMAKQVLPMITTDMTNDEITTCLWEILPLLPELTIEQGTCPVQGTYWGEVIDLFGYPASVLKFEAPQQKKLMRAITEGITE